MRLLLDSHTLIWAADDRTRLAPVAQSLLDDPTHDCLMSVATLWEVGIKFSLGRLRLSLPYRQWIEGAITDLDLFILPITLDHAERQVGLPWHHRDPFDRLLVAQSLVEGVPLVSADATLDAYGVARLW